MRSAVIYVRTWWERCEADGSKCACCGEQCFLTMWRLFFASEKLAKRTGTCSVMCDACHQAEMET